MSTAPPHPHLDPGGTDRYTGVSGSMLLHARGNPVGSEYDFIFHLYS